jgi:ABC-type transport system involved in multi-copper enzyme maturation permease subunit
MIAALRYEWRRLASVRSTWIIAVIAFAQAAGFIWLFAAFTGTLISGSSEVVTPPPVEFRTIVPFIFLPFFPLIVSTLAAQAFGHDYRHGTIRLTLSSFPRRGQILFARVFMLLFFVTILSVVTVGASVGVIEIYSSTTGGIEWASFAGTALKLWAYLLGYMVICMSLVVLTRIMALGIVIPLVMVLIVENLLILLGQWKADWLPEWVPFTNASNWVTDMSAGDGGLNLSGTPWPFFGLAAILSLAATYRFMRKDA